MLHIGGDYIVPAHSIIAVCSADSVQMAACVNRLKAGGHSVKIEGETKSIVLCSDGEGERVYLSPISSRTLYQRLRSGDGLPQGVKWRK